MTLEFKLFEDYKLEFEKSFKGLDELMNLETGPKAWVELPRQDIDYANILEIAEEIREKADVFILCGIGGSYLGARSVIEAIQGIYKNDIEVIYTGNSLNPNEICEILEYIQDKEVYMNVISKSGSTMETCIAFSIFKDFIENKYENPEERIIVTTGDNDGLLNQIAQKENYRTLRVPDNIGGRYSLMTNVGLLPLAVAGIDIKEFIKGAKDSYKSFTEKSKDNPALIYSAFRTHMDETGKAVEILISYDFKLDYIGEWWMQLYGESQGKDHKGMYPSTLVYSRDLHSVGQFIQDGRRNIFETVLEVKKPKEDITIPWIGEGESLVNRSLNEVNRIAVEAAMEAHLAGGVPNARITIDEITPYNLGQLIYFFMVSCAINSYELGVNPFDQPGVEAYKINIKNKLK